MYGLIGEKLGHSFSKTIHELLWAEEYRLLPMTREQLDAFLQTRDFDGVNVTIPYKQTVLPYCDEIDEKAQAIGCVNTIVHQNGRLIGHNTDFDGAAYCLRRAGISLTGKRVLILGTGSTSLTLRAVAQAAGAAEVQRVSRSGTLTYENAHLLTKPQVILNATPVGMYPNVAGRPIDLRLFPTVEAVADVVYNPLNTDLVLQAQALGLPACGGLAMLVAQAVYGARHFCGREFSEAETEAVIRQMERDKQNIVLIGMPGCGKTTVGRLLAKRSGRPLVDLDEEIVRQAGKPIPAIFADDGEGAFRALEHTVLSQVSAQGGQIIATGGGAVLREENRTALRRNGQVYFLRRSLDRLPTAGRPLSQAGDLEAMYRLRLPLYEETAQQSLWNDGPPEQVAQAIWKEFCT